MRYNLSNNQKKTIKDVLDSMSEDTPGYHEMEILFAIKAAGKGAKSWFSDDKFTPYPDLTEKEKEEKYAVLDSI